MAPRMRECASSPSSPASINLTLRLSRWGSVPTVGPHLVLSGRPTSFRTRAHLQSLQSPAKGVTEIAPSLRSTSPAGHPVIAHRWVLDKFFAYSSPQATSAFRSVVFVSALAKPLECASVHSGSSSRKNVVDQVCLNKPLASERLIPSICLIVQKFLRTIPVLKQLLLLHK